MVLIHLLMILLLAMSIVKRVASISLIENVFSVNFSNHNFNVKRRNLGLYRKIAKDAFEVKARR
jgi:hypothetical protein